jgi:uncharacterized protein (UPF0335 family)
MTTPIKENKLFKPLEDGNNLDEIIKKELDRIINREEHLEKVRLTITEAMKDVNKDDPNSTVSISAQTLVSVL